jgi:cytochrome P450
VGQVCPFAKKSFSAKSTDSYTKSWYNSYKRSATFAWILISTIIISLCLCARRLDIIEYSLAKLTAIIGVVSSYFILLHLYSRAVVNQFVSTSSLIPGQTKITRKKLPLCGIFRNFYDLLIRSTVPMCDIDIERMHKYGDIYVTFNGFTPFVEVASSELAEIILKEYELFAKCDLRDMDLTYSYKWIGNENIFFANSESWRQMKEHIQPAINEIPIFAPIFNRKASMLCDIFKHKVKDNNDGVDIYLIRWLKAVVLDVAGEAIFGFDFQYLKAENNALLESLSYLLGEIFNPVRIALPIMNHLPLKSNRRMDKCIEDLDRTLENIIHSINQEKSSSDKQAGNMLERLLYRSKDNSISNSQLKSNALVMIIASHETTQISLTATLYYLAKFPKLQEQLRAESIDLFPDLESAFATLDIVSDKHEKETVYAKIRRFHSLGNFILESIRMHTTVTRPVPRIATQDTELAGIRIPKDTVVNINMPAIHMNPKEWENPETFNPDRFAKEIAANRYAYLTFGGGPRVCSGKNFSMIEQKIILCYLLRYFQLELPAPNYELPLKKKSIFVGIINDSFHLRFKPIRGNFNG